MTVPVYPSASPLRPFYLANLGVDPPLVLAPMAGLTHIALRQLVARFGGCGLFTSEMLSCRAVVRENLKTSIYLRRLPGEKPFFYQLVGNNPEEMGRAVRAIEAAAADTEFPADGFDINMGCGAPLIRNRGLGSGLMKEPDTACRIAAAVRSATRLPVTAKIRLGWEEDAEATIAFGRMLEAEGIDGITLHPRLAKEKFKGRARWRYVELLKKNLRIPVIGNGDISSPDDVYKRFEETGCDGVMIGRLAASKPWIFRTIAGLHSIPVELPALYEDFTRLLVENFPEERRLGRLKELTHYFALSFRFGHNLASAVQSAPTMDEAIRRAQLFFQLHPEESRVMAGVS